MTLTNKVILYRIDSEHHKIINNRNNNPQSAWMGVKRLLCKSHGLMARVELGALLRHAATGWVLDAYQWDASLLGKSVIFSTHATLLYNEIFSYYRTKSLYFTAEDYVNGMTLVFTFNAQCYLIDFFVYQPLSTNKVFHTLYKFIQHSYIDLIPYFYLLYVTMLHLYCGYQEKKFKYLHKTLISHTSVHHTNAWPKWKTNRHMRPVLYQIRHRISNENNEVGTKTEAWISYLPISRLTPVRSRQQGVHRLLAN